MVPVGANPTKEADVDFQMVDITLVLRQMEGAGTKLNLLILDACRNNPFAARGLRSTSGGLAQMRAPEGTLISYATQPGNVAQDGGDGNSPYPAETTEAFCDGHVRAFAFFDGVPQSILYDNTKIAVARILGNGKRQRTRAFSELQSHYLFTDRFGRPGKGNDKGKVEGLVGYARRNFLVPIPVFADFEALNAHLLEGCRKRLADRLRGHDGTIGERLEHDLEHFHV